MACEIYQRNWFKLFTPKNLNGAELSLSEGLEQIIAASAVHGSIGWNVNLGSGAGYFYRFFDAETAQKIFSDSKAVIAGSGHATGKALPIDGGFKVTGSWDKCSGQRMPHTFRLTQYLKMEEFIPSSLHAIR
jgi:hypothetical protein